MSGHGHVTPNADGAKAKCGGPGLCPACSRELADLCRDSPNQMPAATWDAIAALQERVHGVPPEQVKVERFNSLVARVNALENLSASLSRAAENNRDSLNAAREFAKDIDRQNAHLLAANIRFEQRARDAEASRDRLLEQNGRLMDQLDKLRDDSPATARALSRVEQTIKETSGSAHRSEFHRGWDSCCSMISASIKVEREKPA